MIRLSLPLITAVAWLIGTLAVGFVLGIIASRIRKS